MCLHTYVAHVHRLPDYQSVLARIFHEKSTGEHGVGISQKNRSIKSAIVAPTAVAPIVLEPTKAIAASGRLQEAPGEVEEKNFNKERASRVNLYGKIGFAFVIGVFNIAFWTIALRGYMQPPESYL